MTAVNHTCVMELKVAIFQDINLSKPEKRLATIVEIDGWIVIRIEVATGCTLRHR